MSASLFPELEPSAVLSDDGIYRYLLERTWRRSAPPLVFVMLNPSTADADHDDPTIRRCIGFAKANAAGGIRVINLFAYRSTDPGRLLLAPDPVGPDNPSITAGTLYTAAAAGSTVVAAWGSAGDLPAVANMVRRFRDLADGLVTLHCLGTTFAGHPRHPLYVPNDTPLVPWTLGGLL